MSVKSILTQHIGKRNGTPVVEIFKRTLTPRKRDSFASWQQNPRTGNLYIDKLLEQIQADQTVLESDIRALLSYLESERVG